MVRLYSPSIGSAMTTNEPSSGTRMPLISARLWPAAHLAIHDRQQVLILNAAEAAATIPSLAFTP